MGLFSRHRSILHVSAVKSALLRTSFSQFENHLKKLSIHCNILLVLNTYTQQWNKHIMACWSLRLIQITLEICEAIWFWCRVISQQLTLLYGVPSVKLFHEQRWILYVICRYSFILYPKMFMLQLIHNMGKNCTLCAYFCCVQSYMLYWQFNSFMSKIIYVAFRHCEYVVCKDSPFTLGY